MTSDDCKKFSCVTRIRSAYVKHSPRSGKCSALWIMTVRPAKHFLLKEKWLWSGFLKFKSLKLCQASEYSIILCEFLAKTLTSEARRKFFMRRMHTFWVCKMFSWIRATQRTLNQNHTTHRTFHIAKRGKIDEKMYRYFSKFSPRKKRKTITTTVFFPPNF